MRFWMTTLLLNLLIPVIILIMGIMYLKKPSKQINWTHGYRTERSMKNQETWEFAQKYFGGVCCRYGTLFTLLTLVSMLSALGQNEKDIVVLGNAMGIAEGLMMVYILLPTERALKKKYGG